VAYASVTDVKIYRGINTATAGTAASTKDDVLLAVLVAAAQKQVDSYCDRTFEASTKATRYYDAVTDVDQGSTRLWLGADCCAVGTIMNGTGVAVSKYVTEPRNAPPYYAIKLKDSAGELFQYEDDPQDAITVLAKWAYSTKAPADVAQATIRLAAYMYAQKDSQVFDVSMFPDAGVMTVPQGMPKDVQEMLRPYRRI
jgi:hypothetical protein